MQMKLPTTPELETYIVATRPTPNLTAFLPKMRKRCSNGFDMICIDLPHTFFPKQFSHYD